MPVPKDNEIAGEIIEAMITTKQIKNEEELEKILLLPYFNSKLLNKHYYQERLQIKMKEVMPLLTVDSLKDAQTVEKVKEALRQEVEKEVIAKKAGELESWDEKINQKTQEYQALPSIVDGEEYPMPDETEPQAVAEIYVPWWVKLGLSDNAFLELEGVYKVDKILFEKVVTKTEIFKKYESIAENATSDLFRNTILHGFFGSGKTTFFDYMQSKLSQIRIITIYVQLSSEFELGKIISDFYKGVNVELRKIYTIFMGETFPFTEGVDDEEASVEMMKKLDSHEARGFVFFVDDLHKGDDLKAMQFLSHLQVLASRWRRASKLKIGFFIAGSNEWKPLIAGSSKFSGSIDKQENMPILKIDYALDAINRRLKTFAKNPENPKTIEKDFLEKIYKGIQVSGRDLTFRNIMRDTVEEFEQGHFDAFTTNPLDLTAQQLNEIRGLLIKNESLCTTLNSIAQDSTLKPFNRKHCLELLIKAYLSNGLLESEIREVDIPHLQRLQKAGLIIKFAEDNTLRWRISRELYNFNKQTIKLFSLSIEDYVLKLFEKQIPVEKQSKIVFNEEFDKIDTLLSNTGNNLARRFIEDIEIAHKKILESKDKYLNNEIEVYLAISDFSEVLAKLTKAYMLTEGFSLPEERGNIEVLSFWNNFWWSSETIKQYTRAVKSDINDSQKLAYAFSMYKEAFHEILYFFANEAEYSHFFSIPVVNLTNEEIKLLHECRQFLRDNKNYEIAERLVKVIETKIRVSVFNIFTILYGDYDNRVKWLDKESRDYIATNAKKDHDLGFRVSKNEFQQLNRSQYKNIMTGLGGRSEGRRNWNCIFKCVFPRWFETDVFNYLSNLADINIRSSHFKFDTLDQEEQDYLFDFMQKSKRFLIYLNTIYNRLLTGDYFKFSEGIAQFSLCSFKVNDGSIDIELKTDDIQRVINLLKARGPVRLPFDDQEYVEGLFEGLAYRKVYATLALLVRGISDPTDNTRYSLEIIDSKGPGILMNLLKVSFAPKSENTTANTNTQ